MSNYTKQAAEVTYHHFAIMAGCSKQFDFVFDGGLQSQTRASLVNEVVKHLLYERNQIPLQFDILKQQMMVNEAKSLQVANGKPKNGLHQNQMNNKAKNVISNLDKVFENILKAFETCPEIQQALVLLGSTPVTPKESYIIRLPHICPEADNISLKSSKQALFRHLVAEQVLSSDTALGPTNMYVVLCAPRSATLHGFVPKTTFKVPTRGHCLTLNMICNQPSFCSQDLTMDDTEVEISGIEPLDHSSFSDVTPLVVAGNVKSPSPEKMARVLSSGGSCKVMRVRHGSDLEIREGESGKVQFCTPLTRSTPKAGYTTLTACDQLCIWFQCATVIKGYRI